MYEVTVAREFCSAHFLRDFKGPCANMHGHNWKVEVHFRDSELAPNGIMIDFLVIELALNSLLARLDHSVINHVPPFDITNPTAENLAKWFYTEIGAALPDRAPKPSRVTVWETANTSASYWEDE